MNVFISYAREDSEIARALASQLDADGASIWIDVKDIPAGKKWRNEIDLGLVTSEIMILLVSSNSIASSYVAYEWEQFIKASKPIIPLKIQDDVDLPSELKELQWIRFDASDFQESYVQLIDELKGYGLRIFPINLKEKRRSKPPNYALWGIVATIVVGVITALATIAAPILEKALNVANEISPSSLEIETNIPSTSQGTEVNLGTLTPIPTESTLTQTPNTLSIEDIASDRFSLLFGNENSLTILVNENSDISGLRLETAIKSDIPFESFDILQITNGLVEAGMCLRYERMNTDDVIPRTCEQPFVLVLADVDVFWYDDSRNRLLDVAIYTNSALLVRCASSAPSCSFG